MTRADTGAWPRRAVLALGLLLASCVAPVAPPAAAADGALPGRARRAARADAALPAGVRRIADVPYGSDPRQRMDVYLPDAGAPDRLPAPVLFMVHGGGWRRGDKAMARMVQNKVARWVPEGLVLVSVNYRLLPEAPMAEQVRDVAHALATAQRRAAEWGADPDRFILMGHSAGAHLVALVNARPADARRQGARPWLGAVALDSAMYDVPARMRAPHLPLYDAAFGSDPAYWRALSPYDQLSAGAAPYLLVCSTERRDRPCLQSEHLARKARALGVRAEVLPQALSHAQINAELGLDSAYTRAVEAFMASLDARVARRLRRAGA